MFPSYLEVEKTGSSYFESDKKKCFLGARKKNYFWKWMSKTGSQLFRA